MTTIIILCIAPIAFDCWLALREWDARRFPTDRWFGPRKVEAFSAIEETF